jgi:hypothetical protein
MAAKDAPVFFRFEVDGFHGGERNAAERMGMAQSA